MEADLFSSLIRLFRALGDDIPILRLCQVNLLIAPAATPKSLREVEEVSLDSIA